MTRWGDRHHISLRPVLIHFSCEMCIARKYHISRPGPPQLLRMIWRISVQRCYPLNCLVTSSGNRSTDKIREGARHHFCWWGLRHAFVCHVAGYYRFDFPIVPSLREQRGEQVGYIVPIYERGETAAWSEGPALSVAGIYHEVGIRVEKVLLGRVADTGDGTAVGCL